MTDIELAIAKALLERLESNYSPPLPVQWPNKPFVPPNGEPFLRATILPGQPTSLALGAASENRHVGFMQVDVMWPAAEGATEPLRRAQAITTLFARGTDIATEAGFPVQINRPPYVMAGFTDQGRYIVPVRIFYLADTPNAA